jgi:hypothetical protein
MPGSPPVPKLIRVSIWQMTIEVKTACGVSERDTGGKAIPAKCVMSDLYMEVGHGTLLPRKSNVMRYD